MLVNIGTEKFGNWMSLLLSELLWQQVSDSHRQAARRRSRGAAARSQTVTREVNLEPGPRSRDRTISRAEPEWMRDTELRMMRGIPNGVYDFSQHIRAIEGSPTIGVRSGGYPEEFNTTVGRVFEIRTPSQCI